MSGTGDGVPTPDIDISPVNLTYTNTIIGKTASRNVTVTNLGTADLTINTIGLCTGTSTEYTWTPDAPFTLTPKTSQIVSVSYSPLDEGIDAGCISVSSDDPDEAVVEIGLQGSGTIYSPSILQFMSAILSTQQKQ